MDNPGTQATLGTRPKTLGTRPKTLGTRPKTKTNKTKTQQCTEKKDEKHGLTKKSG